MKRRRCERESTEAMESGSLDDVEPGSSSSLTATTRTVTTTAPSREAEGTTPQTSMATVLSRQSQHEEDIPPQHRKATEKEQVEEEEEIRSRKLHQEEDSLVQMEQQGQEPTSSEETEDGSSELKRQRSSREPTPLPHTEHSGTERNESPDPENSPSDLSMRRCFLLPTVKQIENFLVKSLPLRSSLADNPANRLPCDDIPKVPFIHSLTGIYAKDQAFRAELQVATGLRIVNIPPDSSNLFRCIAYHLYGDSEMHMSIREDCLNYIMTNKHYYEHFLLIGIEEYVANKRRSTVHASHVELHAIADLYNRHITIYHYNKDKTFHMGTTAAIFKKQIIKVSPRRPYKTMVELSHMERMIPNAEFTLSRHMDSYYNVLEKVECPKEVVVKGAEKIEKDDDADQATS